ncbi:MAG: hypothetical protein ACOCUS_02230 [Polyangiales bacterium]
MAGLPESDIRPPTGRTRKRVSLFVGAFLALQLFVPLTYYMRDDPYDERFAWRMFSAIRVYGCRTWAFDVHEGPDGERRSERLELSKEIHVAWITTMRRNRRDVIHAFLRRRCEEPGVVESRVVNRCSTPDGERIGPLEYERDCATGDVTEPEDGTLP